MKRRFVAHPNDETVDGITIDCHDRFKESELSGSEWRFSYRITLWRKGHKLAVDGGHLSLDAAVAHLPWLMKTWGESERYREIPKDELASLDTQVFECAQPGCCGAPVVALPMVRRWSRDCTLSEPAQNGEVRMFCPVHSNRGDSGLDDGESNYGEPLQIIGSQVQEPAK